MRFMHPMSSGKISFSHFETNLVRTEEKNEDIVDKSMVKYSSLKQLFAN